jgi:hypothetical protein
MPLSRGPRGHRGARSFWDWPLLLGLLEVAVELFIRSDQLLTDIVKEEVVVARGGCWALSGVLLSPNAKERWRLAQRLQNIGNRCVSQHAPFSDISP